jgi:hypothetical protein
MNTQLAFAFGVLAMIAIIMIAVIVVGIVKVVKHDRIFKVVQEDINGLHRHITGVESNLYGELNDRFKDADRKIDNAYTNARDISNTYTDSRIDKLEQKLTGKKQILKD